MNARLSSTPHVCWRPGQDVWLESQNYVMRTLKAEDAFGRILGL